MRRFHWPLQRVLDVSTQRELALRSELIARARGSQLNTEQIRNVVSDLIPPDIGKTRRYQTLQALANCTRRSLLPDPNVDDATRQAWRQEILSLEREGIR